MSKRTTVIKIRATIYIPYDADTFGETTKAENRALELEKSVRTFPGVTMGGWVVTKTSRANGA